MDVKFLIEVGGLVAIIACLGFVTYYYYKSVEFKKAVDKVLPFLPSLFSMLGKNTKDTKGVFDAHDSWVLLGRVSEELRNIVSANSNVTFEDVEDDVVRLVNRELKRYRDAGVKNIPDFDEEAVKASARLVFEQIKNAFREN